MKPRKYFAGSPPSKSVIQPSPDAVVEGVAAEVCVVDLDLSAVVEVGAVTGEVAGVDCAESPAQPLNTMAKPLTSSATQIVVDAFFMDS